MYFLFVELYIFFGVSIFRAALGRGKRAKKKIISIELYLFRRFFCFFRAAPCGYYLFIWLGTVFFGFSPGCARFIFFRAVKFVIRFFEIDCWGRVCFFRAAPGLDNIILFFGRGIFSGFTFCQAAPDFLQLPVVSGQCPMAGWTARKTTHERKL